MIGLGAISGAAFGRGARVIAVDVDDAKLAIARKAGAVETVNSVTEPLHGALQALTQGEGPGVVIEAVGSPATYRAAIDEVAFAGRVVYIGYAKEPVGYDNEALVLKELDIYGSRNATRENFADVIRVLESGRYPVGDTVTRSVLFADAAVGASRLGGRSDTDHENSRRVVGARRAIRRLHKLVLLREERGGKVSPPWVRLRSGAGRVG